MKDEYIRKRDMLEAFGLSEKTRKYGGDHSGYDTRMLYEIQDTIESLEPADVTEITHGEWMSAPEIWGMFNARYYCSKCGKDAIINNSERYVLSDYCPHCGAIMDNKRGNENE